MPSHTIPSALINFYVLVPGAPWTYACWREITGMLYGLFPEDRSKLHKDLNPLDVDDILSYIDQYSKLRTEEAKIKFTMQRNGPPVPGRLPWRDFINKNWTKWKIHTIITKILMDNDIHPITLTILNPDYKGVPSSRYQIPKVMDEVGATLFGDEALLPTGRLPLLVGESTVHIIQRTWIILCRQIGRNRARLFILETAARDAFNGE